MNIPTLPPDGKEQLMNFIMSIRDSKWVRMLRKYQTLVLAIVCVVFAAILGLLSQTATNVVPTETVATEMVRDLTTPLTVDTPTFETTNVAEVPTTTPTAITTPIGPNPPGYGTSTTFSLFPTRELPSGAYPTPDNGPIGMGSTETIPPFPTSDTSYQWPTTPPSSSGNSPNPTTYVPAPPSQSDDKPTYPGPGQTATDYVPPTNIPVPTDRSPLPNPTDPPKTDPGNPSAPTDEPKNEPTVIPTDSVPPTEAPPTNTPVPTEPPYNSIAGNVHWTLGQSPVIVKRNSIIPSGSTLTIDDGVEVRLDPDVSLTVDGTLNAQGARFRKNGTGNWQSLVVTRNGRATLSGVDMRGGGSNGVLISALGGSTVIQDSRFEENKGKILADGGSLDLQRNSIVGYAPINANVVGGASLRLIGNVIYNTATDGANGVVISASSPDVTINVENNSIKASSGTNLRAQFNQSLNATFRCNTFSGGSVGLQIKSTDPTLDGSRIIINNNNFLTHRNYGASSDVGLDVRNNWWGDASGPFETQENPTGTGDAAGVNLTVSPWLTTPSSCAP